MAFSSWRGIAGMIAPTMRPGMTEEVIRLLPEGIGVIPLFLNIRRGTTEEFRKTTAAYEEPIALLAEQGCDVIHPIGAPPFMVQGREAETRLIGEWQEKFGVPIFTAPQNHVTALDALGAKKIVGATYFPDHLNRIFARYMEDAGIEVLCMDGIEAPFDKVQEIAAEQIYAHIKRSFLRTPGADAIYMLGSAWRTLPIIEPLEQDLGVPVVHPVASRVWELQKRLHVNQPVPGHGALLGQMI